MIMSVVEKIRVQYHSISFLNVILNPKIKNKKTLDTSTIFPQNPQNSSQRTIYGYFFETHRQNRSKVNHQR